MLKLLFLSKVIFAFELRFLFLMTPSDIVRRRASPSRSSIYRCFRLTMSFNSVEFLKKKILFYVILVSEVIQEKKKGKNRKQLYLRKQFALTALHKIRKFRITWTAKRCRGSILFGLQRFLISFLIHSCLKWLQIIKGCSNANWICEAYFAQMKRTKCF